MLRHQVGWGRRQNAVPASPAQTVPLTLAVLAVSLQTAFSLRVVELKIHPSRLPLALLAGETQTIPMALKPFQCRQAHAGRTRRSSAGVSRDPPPTHPTQAASPTPASRPHSPT